MFFRRRIDRSNCSRLKIQNLIFISADLKWKPVRSTPEIDLLFENYLTKSKISYFHQTVISTNTTIRKILLSKVVSLLDQILIFFSKLNGFSVFDEPKSNLNYISSNNQGSSSSSSSPEKVLLDEVQNCLARFYTDVMRLAEKLHLESYNFRIFTLWLEMVKMTGTVSSSQSNPTESGGLNEASSRPNDVSPNNQETNSQGPDNPSGHNNNKTPSSTAKNFTINLSEKELDICYDFIESGLFEEKSSALISQNKSWRHFNQRFDDFKNFRFPTQSQRSFPKVATALVTSQQVSDYLGNLEDFTSDTVPSKEGGQVPGIYLRQKASGLHKLVYKFRQIRFWERFYFFFHSR